MKIAYYVSGHGFGHISRSFEIVKEFLKRGAQIQLITTRLGFLEEIPAGLSTRSLATDIGVIQYNSLQIDLAETKKNIELFWENEQSLVDSEILELKKWNVDMIISDSSSLPLYLAKELGIPGYYIGNFTWDFIYQNYSSQDSIFLEFANHLSKQYRMATKGFVLPFHCPIDAIENKEYIGLIGRKPNHSKEEMKKKLGFDQDKIYILFSFGAYGLNPDEFDFSNLDPKIQIVVSRLEGFRRPEILALDNVYYPDIVTACDYVITKPGYGILTECYFGNTPIFYTDRGDFAEYPYLVDSLKRYFFSQYISQKSLYQMKVHPFLTKTADLCTPEKLNTNGMMELLVNFF